MKISPKANKPEGLINGVSDQSLSPRFTVHLVVVVVVQDCCSLISSPAISGPTIYSQDHSSRSLVKITRQDHSSRSLVIYPSKGGLDFNLTLWAISISPPNTPLVHSIPWFSSRVAFCIQFPTILATAPI